MTIFKAEAIQAILFDIDGTLADTDDVHVAKWAQRAARVYEEPAQAEGAARSLVRWLANPANAFFALLDVVGLDTLVMRLMIRAQGSGDPARLPIIAGTIEAVKSLYGRYPLGVVSTRTEGESRAFLEAAGIAECFGVIVGRDTTWRIKPHPQPIQHAAAALGVSPGRVFDGRRHGGRYAVGAAGGRMGVWCTQRLWFTRSAGTGRGADDARKRRQRARSARRGRLRHNSPRDALEKLSL